MAQPLSRGEGKAGGRPRAGGPDLLRPLRTARSTSSRPFPPCTPFPGGSPSPRSDPALQPPSRFSSGRSAPTSSPGRNRGSCRPRRGARCDRRLRHSGAWSRVGRGRARRLAAPGSLVLRVPGLRPAVRTPLSVLRRLARACGHCTLTSTLPRRLWPKEFWVPDVPRGPRLHPSGRRWATWLTVPGGRCRVARPGPAAQGPALPRLNQTPRERREQVPPGETKLLVPTPETPAPAAPAGQPGTWTCWACLVLGPGPSSLLLGPLPCLAIHTGDRAARSWARHSEATRVRSRLSLVPSGSCPPPPLHPVLFKFPSWSQGDPRTASRGPATASPTSPQGLVLGSPLPKNKNLEKSGETGKPHRGSAAK